MEERVQFTRSDEARVERVGVGVVLTEKRLERVREVATGGQSVRPTPIYVVDVCISSFPDEDEE